MGANESRGEELQNSGRGMVVVVETHRRGVNRQLVRDGAAERIAEVVGVGHHGEGASCLAERIRHEASMAGCLGRELRHGFCHMRCAQDSSVHTRAAPVKFARNQEQVATAIVP